MVNMNRTVLAATFAIVAALGPLLAGCGGGGAAKHRVAVEVTQEGFVPNEIHAKVGEPITLVVTRKTDLTCAKQFVFAEFSVEKELPLDQPVEVTVTPTKAGDLPFACGMDMVTGKLIAE
jgi:plastocyanin domain-containing protein